jgi:hypothetical protein
VSFVLVRGGRGEGIESVVMMAIRRKHAWGHDELMPVSNLFSNNYNGELSSFAGLARATSKSMTDAASRARTKDGAQRSSTTSIRSS